MNTDLPAINDKRGVATAPALAELVASAPFMDRRVRPVLFAQKVRSQS